MTDCIARVSHDFKAPIAFVINNAGGEFDNGAHCADLTVKDFERAFELNTLGHIRVIHAVLPTMRARKFGRISNVTSRSGSFAGSWKNAPAYGVSKCAMNMYVMQLAHGEEGSWLVWVCIEVRMIDLKDSGVLVNACCPGWVRTRMGGEEATLSPEEVSLILYFICWRLNFFRVRLLRFFCVCLPTMDRLGSSLLRKRKLHGESAQKNEIGCSSICEFQDFLVLDSFC